MDAQYLNEQLLQKVRGNGRQTVLAASRSTLIIVPVIG